MNLSRLPRRKVTVDELLSRDDVVGIIQKLNENLDDIKHLVTIYQDKSGVNHIRCSDMMVSDATWMLEDAKLTVMGYGDDNGDG